MRKDQVSHYILRLAYCRTEDLRRWFLAHECHLLKYRVDSMSTTARANFMHTHGLADDKLTSEEKEARRHKLIGLAGITELNFASNEFYKVPFQQALSLLAHRQVYIEKGYAFLPIGKLVATVVSRFRILLSRALIEASQMFDHVSGDTRIGPLLKNMNKQYIGKDFSKSAGSGVDKLTPDIIDDAAENNMPLCMKNLHQNLKKEHKLKHWGRLQYGLFLKGAGMELEDAMVFWESHFTRLLSHDNFQKQYAYSFRHMYGKEGARKNYTPYSCMKIIMGAAPEAGGEWNCADLRRELVYCICY
jgi:DNA primase large subunit